MEEVVTEQDFAERKAFGKEETVGKLASRARAAENGGGWEHKRCRVRRGRWAFRGRRGKVAVGGTGRWAARSLHARLRRMG